MLLGPSCSNNQLGNADHNTTPTGNVDTDEVIQQADTDEVIQPEMFRVDGEPCENKTPEKIGKNKTEERKRRRNSGLEFTNRHGKHIPSRLNKPLGPGCDSSKSRCEGRDLLCAHFTDEQRLRIRSSYFGLGDLQSQREWIARYIDLKKATESTEDSRRNWTIDYTLPRPSEITTTISSKIRVCKKMFLDTLGISARQVCTVTEKITDEGTLERMHMVTTKAIIIE